MDTKTKANTRRQTPQYELYDPEHCEAFNPRDEVNYSQN